MRKDWHSGDTRKTSAEEGELGTKKRNPPSLANHLKGALPMSKKGPVDRPGGGNPRGRNKNLILRGGGPYPPMRKLLTSSKDRSGIEWEEGVRHKKKKREPLLEGEISGPTARERNAPLPISQEGGECSLNKGAHCYRRNPPKEKKKDLYQQKQQDFRPSGGKKCRL